MLLAVLIFMQLFSMLSLFSLMSASMAIKSQQQLLARSEVVWKVEALLKQIERYVLMGGHSCRIKVMPTAQLIVKPLSWWQQFSCSGNLAAFRYYYAIEYVGNDVCARIESMYHAASIPEYYRITLIALLDKPKDAKVTMQSTIAKATHRVSSCQGKIHIVNAGRQMHRVF